MGFKIGLALGGGGSKGLAHLGVIKALEEADIAIDIVTGASIGAVVGAIYSTNAQIHNVIKQIHDYLHSEDFQRTRLEFIKNSQFEENSYIRLKKFLKTGIFLALSLQKKSFISNEEFKSNLEYIVPDMRIEDCKVTLGLVSMDLQTGREIVFTRGNLIECVMASSAIPGIFPPLETDDNEVLVDGSWVNPIPSSVAKRLGADFIIAVDVTPRISDDIRGDNGWNISLRASEATRLSLKNHNLQIADHSISIDLTDVHWADFLQIDRCLAAGEQVMIENLEILKKKLFWRKLKSKIF